MVKKIGKYLAGIDIGTSGAKVAIFSLDGKVVGSGYKEYKCIYPKPNWVDQDIDYLLDCTMNSCREALTNSNIDTSEIMSISLSSQRTCSIFIDKKGKPLRNMISWQDNRAYLEVEYIKRKILQEEFYKTTGLPLSTTWLLPKILWFKKNEPAAWEKVYRIVQVQDYVLKALGVSNYYCDISDIVTTGMWDTDYMKWDKKLMKIAEIEETMLSIPTLSGSCVGKISKKVAEKTGFLEGTPICVGAGDTNCSALGAGIVTNGQVSVSIGTGGIAVAYLDKPYRDPKQRLMVTNHVIHGKWQLEGFQAGAAGVFRWFKDEIATMEKLLATSAKENIYTILDKIVSSTPAGSNGLIVLPYFASAAAPRWNPNARGSVIGLTFAHDRACLTRAFMEGITMEQKDILNTMSEELVINDVRVIGGAAKSNIWNQIQADMYNMPVKTLRTPDSPVLGAAMLGGIGIGLFKDVDEATDAMVFIEKRYDPIKKM